MEKQGSKTARFFLHLIFFIRRNFLVFVVIFISYLLVKFGQRGLVYMKELKVKPKDLFGFLGNTSESLTNQSGITNFLVLGLRGEGEESPDLTDSIIFFSLNQNKNEITQIGIPRDLWVPSHQAKINAAYHYGEEASPGAGIKFAETAILETLGQPINYTVIVNFSLFKQIIDLVGGVDVNVSPGFTDDKFPIPGKENAMPISSRYETISFPEGSVHMDGATALKFVRSRHSVGDEGTDFARSVRQQKVIGSLKDKLFTKEFLLSQQKTTELIKIVENNLITNVHSSLYPVLARVGLNQAGKTIKTVTLDTVAKDQEVAILYNPPVGKYKGEWVLMPKDDNWKALKQYIESKLTNE
jgi:LCP family protein required for cell wall assembly